ncbi:MAG TPA: protein kinase [Terriglobia bacterium]|nr:protein kinase [Terriglobia bacterium]
MHTISHYQALETLGNSGQATVYKAWDLELERCVALKVLYETPGENFTAFQEETGKLSRLRHPHIAEVWDVGRISAQSFVVTEYLSGGTLKARIRLLNSEGARLPSEDIISYSLQIGDGLVHAHRQGVHHRNLKTENVMFSETGVLKLTDFVLNESRGLENPVETDLIDFGALLYELATGELPPAQTPLPPIEHFRSDLPDAFKEIVSRMLHRERADCYRDIEKVVNDLKPLDKRSDITVPLAASPEFGVTQRQDRVSDSPFYSTFSPGRLLAGRFKIIRFLARGGMGEVYEAEDLELGEHIALKTIRPEIALEEQALARFKQEIHLARKVTHPNVCRIFDVFHHVEASEAGTGPRDKITFLSMELLNGETLSERIRRAGPMAPQEAWPMILQMAAALSAAHKAGVIHRDFKSSNVILVPAGPSSNGAQDYRVVVTDFGLARSSLAGQSLFSIPSGAGAFQGTPAYMAPEQVEGEEITASADIYALGVVMYEMVTGKLPFTGESALAIAFKRLKKTAPSPRVHVPDLDSEWESSIMRCLERKPTDRFPSVGHLLEALGGEKASPVPGAVQQPRKHVVKDRAGSRRLMMTTGATVLVGVLLGVLLFQNLHRTPGASASRRSVAVLGFRNLTGEADAAWLSTALAEWLTTELGAGEKLRAIPGENVARMQVELSLPEPSSFASDTLARIRTYLGADVVISGSYLVLNGIPSKVRLDLRAQDSMTGGLLATISEEGYPTELFDLVSRTGAQLRVKLGVQNPDARETNLAQASLPANLDAARSYSEALEKLRFFDALGARPLLEKTVTADPGHALAHAALATTWSMLGYGNKARDEGKKALDLSSRLSREDRLSIEGRYRESALQWDQAAEVYRTLFGFFPDNLDYGLRLASAQTSAGKAKDAMATVETLRKSPAFDGNSPRIDLAEARAAGALSDFKHQQVLAANAVTKGRTQGARLLVAGGRLLEGNALANLGELDQARAAFEDANRMYSAAGDHWDAANSATNLAFVLAKSGDSRGAKNIYEQSLATYRQLGDRGGTAAALTSLASLFRSQANLTDAKSMHEQALAIYRELSDRVGEARALNNLANVSGLEGNLPGAQKTYEAALAVFREIGDRNGAATVLGNLADLLSEKGDLARASTLYDESLAAFRDVGNNSSVAYSLTRLGDLLLTQGDLAGARKKHEEALALRTQLGEKGSIADSRLALAHISLQEGSPVPAEEGARAAIEEFRIENRADDEASAMAVLARSLLSQEKRSEAKQAIDRAEEISSKSLDGSLRLSVGITAASIRASTGQTARATSDLSLIVAEARKASLVSLELEARLALAEIEMASGHLETARVILMAVEKEALSKGYKHIANRAAAAGRNTPARKGSKTAD